MLGWAGGMARPGRGCTAVGARLSAARDWMACTATCFSFRLGIFQIYSGLTHRIIPGELCCQLA